MKLKLLFFLLLLTLLSLVTHQQDFETEKEDTSLNGFKHESSPFEDSLPETTNKAPTDQRPEDEFFLPEDSQPISHKSSFFQTPHLPSEDELFVNTAVKELSKPKINIDKFIDEIDRIDCSKFNGDKLDPLNVLCDAQLVNTAFEPLGHSNTDHNDFYNYLQKVVYQPLAYNVDKRVNLSDMVLDSMHLNPKNSLFHGQAISVNYNDFEQSILTLFEGMADKTNNMEENKDDIGDMIMNTLKRFHLYWNNLRYNNKFDKLKVDTKEILRTLLKSYHSKKEFLNYTSKTLIQNLLQAYFKFVRAHKILGVAKQKGPQLISSQMILRFREVAKIIQAGNFNNIWFVKEISHFLNLLQVFNILSTKQGLSQGIVLKNFQTDILMVIQSEYEQLQSGLLNGASVEQVRLFKHFTATLLLKFKHLSFIMFQIHGINQYLTMPQSNYLKSPFAIKIYYEMLDNMLLIPKTCSEATLLKNCVLDETSKGLKFMVDKYNIKRSTYGWFFLQQLSTMTKSIFEHANNQTWQNWSNFKNYYYSNLFSVMYTYKKLYGVNEMDSISKLETQTGSLIDAGKKKNLTKPINFGLIDILDKDIYNEFLGIKADFNNYSPVEKNPLILSYVQIRIVKFFDNFEKQHVSDINSDITEILVDLKDNLKEWVSDAEKQGDQSFASRAFASQELENLKSDKYQVDSLKSPLNDIENSPPAEDSPPKHNKSEHDDELSFDQAQLNSVQETPSIPLQSILPNEIPQLVDLSLEVKPIGLEGIKPLSGEAQPIDTLPIEQTSIGDNLIEELKIIQDTQANLATLPLEESQAKVEKGLSTIDIPPDDSDERIIRRVRRLNFKNNKNAFNQKI